MPLLYKDIVFIINPNSGRKSADRILRKMQTDFPDIKSVVIKDIKSFNDFMYLNIGQYNAFIVAGGDGTVNSAVNYLAGKNNKYLAVYPTGSGNGFARELGFKAKINHLIKDVLKAETLAIDLLKVNDECCVNMTGLGFDAHIAHEFAIGKKRGLNSYLKLIMRSVLKFPVFEAEIQYGKKQLQGKFKMISAANTRQFGNGALIAPQASPCDGIMDIVLLKDCKLSDLALFGIRMMTGKLKPTKYLDFLKTDTEAVIYSDYKKIHIDGEPKQFTDKLRVCLSNQKLNVIKTRYNRY